MIAPAAYIDPNTDWVTNAIKLGAALQQQQVETRQKDAALQQSSAADFQRGAEYAARLKFEQQKEQDDVAAARAKLGLEQSKFDADQTPFTWGPTATPAGPAASVPAMGVPATSDPAAVGSITPVGNPAMLGPLQPAPDFSGGAIDSASAAPMFNTGTFFDSILNGVSNAVPSPGASTASAAAVPTMAAPADAALPPLPDDANLGIPDAGFQPAPMPSRAQMAAGVVAPPATPAADPRLAQIDQAGQFFQQHGFTKKEGMQHMGNVAQSVFSKAATTEEETITDFAQKQGFTRGPDGRWQDPAGQIMSVGIGKGGKTYATPAKPADAGLTPIPNAPGYLQDGKTHAVFRSVQDANGETHILRAGGEFQQARVDQTTRRLDLTERNQLFNQSRMAGKDVAAATKLANETVMARADAAQKHLDHDFDTAQRELDALRNKGFETSAKPNEISQFQQQQALTADILKNRDAARQHADDVRASVANQPVTKLDPVTAAAILKEAGGDKVKATKIATDRGFSE